MGWGVVAGGPQPLELDLGHGSGGSVQTTEMLSKIRATPLLTPPLPAITFFPEHTSEDQGTKAMGHSSKE